MKIVRLLVHHFETSAWWDKEVRWRAGLTTLDEFYHKLYW